MGLDFVFVPDAVIEMVGQPQSRALLKDFSEAGPQVAEYLLVAGRVGAAITDEPNEYEAALNEGKRQMALEMLAVLRCAGMEPEELQELIDQRTGVRNYELDG